MHDTCYLHEAGHWACVLKWVLLISTRCLTSTHAGGFIAGSANGRAGHHLHGLRCAHQDGALVASGAPVMIVLAHELPSISILLMMSILPMSFW
jgi:hypothetical protein